MPLNNDIEDEVTTASSAEAHDAEAEEQQSSTTFSANSPRPPPATAAPPLLQSRTTVVIIRQSLTPYLPPPVVRAMDQVVDPFLEPYLGPEASITICGSLLLAWIVFVLVKFVSQRVVGGSSGGRAIADDDDDDHNVVLSSKKIMATSQEHYDATVLLCGPPDAGKTRIFYQLCYYPTTSNNNINNNNNNNNLPTLMSIKANVGISNKSPITSHDDDHDHHNEPTAAKTIMIRYMDWPGHAPLSDPVLQPILAAAAAATTTRIVLVLDATQPVAAAADCLFDLLSYFYANKSKNNSNKNKGNKSSNKSNIPTIFVACHKSDLKNNKKAKNPRRIKIQLRTELERLLKVRAAAAAVAGTTTTADHAGSSTSTKEQQQESLLFWPPGEPLDDLDELKFVQLYFGSTSCCEKNDLPSAELVTFCQTGKLAS